MAWRLVESLRTLRAEVDAMAPDRSQASDGTIGDAAHQSRASDHNREPDGTVDALDITHDPAHGCDVDAIFAQIIAKRDPRVKYLIRTGRICSGRLGPAAWTWRDRGRDPTTDHFKHGHISVLDENQDDVSPWLDKEDELPYTVEELEALCERAAERAVRKVLDENPDNPPKWGLRWLAEQSWKALFKKSPAGSGYDETIDLVLADTRAIRESLDKPPSE